MSKDPRQDNQMRLDLAAALERQGLAAYQSGKGKVFASCGKLGFIELIFSGETGLAYSHRAPQTAACQSTSTTECAMGAVASRPEMGYSRGDAKLTQSGVGGVGKTTA